MCVCALAYVCVCVRSCVTKLPQCFLRQTPSNTHPASSLWTFVCLLPVAVNVGVLLGATFSNWFKFWFFVDVTGLQEVNDTHLNRVLLLGDGLIGHLEAQRVLQGLHQQKVTTLQEQTAERH